MMKEKYKDAFVCVKKIRDYIQKEHGQDLTKEEMAYLAIHIERVVNRS
jgi:beta-glucoside operon transcriptional antiterminator